MDVHQLPDLPAPPSNGGPRDAVVTGVDVVRRYGEGDTAVEALRGVSVEIAKGRLTAVMGPSGSGKSTLMHILAGLDKPTSGEVSVAGVDITEMDDAALTVLRRDHIGFIFQFFNLLPMLTAAENIVLPLKLAGPVVDLLAGPAAEMKRETDVLEARQGREQVEELEDEAVVVAAQLRQRGVVETGDVDACDRDLARGRLVQAGEDVHQRGLAGARRAHHRSQATPRDIDRNAAQRVDRRVAPAVAADEITGADNRGRRGRRRRRGQGDCWLHGVALLSGGRHEGRSHARQRVHGLQASGGAAMSTRGRAVSAGGGRPRTIEPEVFQDGEDAAVVVLIRG